MDDGRGNHPDQDPNRGWRSAWHIHRLEFRAGSCGLGQTPNNSIKSAVSEVLIDGVAIFGRYCNRE